MARLRAQAFLRFGVGGLETSFFSFFCCFFYRFFFNRCFFFFFFLSFFFPYRFFSYRFFYFCFSLLFVFPIGFVFVLFFGVVHQHPPVGVFMINMMGGFEVFESLQKAPLGGSRQEMILFFSLWFRK